MYNKVAVGTRTYKDDVILNPSTNARGTNLLYTLWRTPAATRLTTGILATQQGGA